MDPPGARMPPEQLSAPSVAAPPRRPRRLGFRRPYLALRRPLLAADRRPRRRGPVRARSALHPHHVGALTMGHFLIVARTPRHDGAAALSADLAKLAQGAGHSLSELTPLAWLAVSGVQRPRLTTVGGWRLIGDVFNRRSPQLPASNAADPWDYERKMLARLWGRFVGVLFAPDHQPSAILRDPSGALECVVWRQDGLTLISSSAPDWL